MSSTREKLIITRTGQARGLVGPLVDMVTKRLGPRTTRRASHVEPTEELPADTIRRILARDNFQHEHLADCELLSLRTTLLPQGWWAELRPVAGPVLGPFSTNTEALAAEKAWLLAHDIPTAGN